MLPSTQTTQVASPTIHTTWAFGLVNGRITVIFPVRRSKIAGPSSACGGVFARASPNETLPSGAMETSTHGVESTDRGLRLGQACENWMVVVGIDDALGPAPGDKSCDLVEDGDCCSPEVAGEQPARNTATIGARTLTTQSHTVRRGAARSTWSTIDRLAPITDFEGVVQVFVE